tara:strand:+ start:193 stop:816 length:624 start_codon:yes stop_codon:yes gene_type:complete
MERVEHSGWLAAALNQDSWYIVQSVFEDEMINFIHSLASKSIEQEGAERDVLGEPLPIDLNNRSCSIRWIDDIQVYETLMDAIENINDNGWRYRITGIESLQYTVYHEDKKQHYAWHADPINHKDLNTPYRKVSCSILLNDPEEYVGGEFEFLSIDIANEQTHSFQPDFFNKKGQGLFFPSQAYHRVKPVTKGIRRSLVCWFTGPRP